MTSLSPTRIRDVDDCIREAKGQLKKDPAATNNDLVDQTIDRSKKKKKQLVNENIVNGLKNQSLRTPQFYISPKIHKEVNPGR